MRLLIDQGFDDAARRYAQPMVEDREELNYIHRDEKMSETLKELLESIGHLIGRS